MTRAAAALALLCAAIPARAFDATAARGLKEWRTYCVGCHGPEGRGNREVERLLRVAPGALDLTRLELQDWPAEQVEDAVRLMAAKRPGLREELERSTEAMSGLVAYLRIVGRGDAVVLSSAAWAGVKDPGERGYLKACAPCHGRSGVGVFDTGWSAPVADGVVDLRPPLPRRKVRKTGRIKPEWIAFDGTLSEAEAAGLVAYLNKLEAALRARQARRRRARAVIPP